MSALTYFSSVFAEIIQLGKSLAFAIIKLIVSQNIVQLEQDHFNRAHLYHYQFDCPFCRYETRYPKARAEYRSLADPSHDEVDSGFQSQ